jgi:hypothetical protein
VAEEVGVDEEREEQRDGDGRGARDEAAQVAEQDVAVAEAEGEGPAKEVVVREGFLVRGGAMLMGCLLPLGRGWGGGLLTCLGAAEEEEVPVPAWGVGLFKPSSMRKPLPSSPRRPRSPKKTNMPTRKETTPTT